MQQFAEILFASGLIGYKDCIQVGLTCKIAHNMFKKWENFIVNNDKEDFVVKYVASTPRKEIVVKDIYNYPEKLFTDYHEVFLRVPHEEMDYLVYLLFTNDICVADKIVDALTKPCASTQHFNKLIIMFIKLLEHHLIIKYVALSMEKASRYLRVVEATYFVLEYYMLPHATSIVILILKGYMKSPEKIHIGPNGGIYRVVNGKKNYIK